MKTYYLLIVLFLVACNTKQAKKQPAPCTDSTYKAYTPDELRSCQLSPDARFIMVINTYKFDDKEHFEKFFLPSPDIDFSRYLITGILVDNKIGVLEGGQPVLKDISLSLKMDTAYIKNCILHIPYTLIRLDSVPATLGHTYTYERKFYLVRIPKQSGITKVKFEDQGMASSQTYIVD
ncbi:hypothetical protein GFS24_03330 [Chitinophaga sp. SYP-B3965]|uniref:hypothetical protein n=1 Tax=Chitinophaga sp. SYP-B3965 TaxID=2663120 RepID=UPI0012999C6D|nr:hypothetical protein [Chitinophaga sp. SYP-B3965]MRG44127.1 hypothetical protein [Chitinophaga sp. SYP-B3965]